MTALTVGIIVGLVVVAGAFVVWIVKAIRGKA